MIYREDFACEIFRIMPALCKGRWILRSKRRRGCLRKTVVLWCFEVFLTIPQSPIGDSSLYTREPKKLL